MKFAISGLMRRVAALCFALLLGCDDEAPGREPELPPRPRGGFLGADGGARALPESIPEDLRRKLLDAAAPAKSPSGVVSRSKLGLAPPPSPGQRVAFGKGRVGRITADALEVFTASSGDRVASITLKDPRRVFPLRDGSLVAVGSARLVRLEPRETKPATYPTLSVFPRSTFLPDAKRKERFWVLHLGVTLYQHELGEAVAGVLPIAELVEAKGFDGKALTLMPDGAFLLTRGRELVRLFPGGKQRAIALPREGSPIWRLVKARRLDRVWAALDNGQIHLLGLGASAETLKTIRPSSTPYEVASGGASLAVVRFGRDGSSPIAWNVEVFDEGGRSKMTALLAPGGGSMASAGWVQEETKNRDVALSPDGRFVAVGGPTALAVWSVASKKKLWTR